MVNYPVSGSLIPGLGVLWGRCSTPVGDRSSMVYPYPYPSQAQGLAKYSNLLWYINGITPAYVTPVLMLYL